jgi:hypothetical protein
MGLARKIRHAWREVHPENGMQFHVAKPVGVF